MHEVPLDRSDVLGNMRNLSDDEIPAACREVNARTFVEQDANDGPKKWEALGAEYHKRVAKNYVTWVRGYVNTMELPTRDVASVPANLQQRPIFWTVGRLNSGAELGEGIWKSNFEVSKAAGLKVNAERLRCLHYPSITVPEELAGWIGECIGKVKD